MSLAAMSISSCAPRSVVLAGALLLALVLPTSAAAARNVVLFVGDGMGPPHLGFLFAWQRAAGVSTSALRTLYEQGTLGLVMTHPSGAVVTDSAAAATAIAGGQRTLPELLGLGPTGERTETVLERARAHGKRTGLVCTTRLTDATPGAFVAHVESRYYQREIAAAVLDGAVDVALGGGARWFVGKGSSVSESLPGCVVSDPAKEDPSGRTDERDLVAEARARGYAVVADRDGLLAFQPSDDGRLLGLFSAENMPAALDGARLLKPIPTLAEMTRAALAVVGRGEQGFFLMVEGSRIDLAAHEHDLGSMLGELRAFDEAVGVAADFASRNPDTLVVVTADHETGGPAFCYQRREAKQPERRLPSGALWRPGVDYGSWETLLRFGKQQGTLASVLRDAGADPRLLGRLMVERVGWSIPLEDCRRALGPAERLIEIVPLALRSSFPYAESSRTLVLAQALAPSTGIVWATGTHTASPVVLAARGPGAASFGGLKDHAQVGVLLKEAVRDGAEAR